MSRLLPMQTRTSTVPPLLLWLLLAPLSVATAKLSSDTGASPGASCPSWPTAVLAVLVLPLPGLAAGPGASSSCGEASVASSGSPARWVGGIASQHLRPRPEMASEATACASQATLRSWRACWACWERHAEGCPLCGAGGSGADHGFAWRRVTCALLCSNRLQTWTATRSSACLCRANLCSEQLACLHAACAAHALHAGQLHDACCARCICRHGRPIQPWLCRWSAWRGRRRVFRCCRRACGKPLCAGCAKHAAALPAQPSVAEHRPRQRVLAAVLGAGGQEEGSLQRALHGTEVR